MRYRTVNNNQYHFKLGFYDKNLQVSLICDEIGHLYHGIFKMAEINGEGDTMSPTFLPRTMYIFVRQFTIFFL